MEGKDLRTKRLIRRMSLQDVAEKLGVARQTVSNWENGAPIPKTKQVMVDALFDGDSVCEPQASYGNNQQGSLDKVVLEQSKQITTMQGQMDRLINIIEKLTDETSHQG